MGESAAASILQPVVDEVVQCISAVVKRQFNYLCCFTANVNGLEEEARTLDDATQGVQGDVEREKNNAQDIVPAVETWLTCSNDFKEEVNGILNEVPNVKSGCFKLSARYSLSKKAMKTAEAMKEHLQKWTGIASNGISRPKPPAAEVQIPSAGGTNFVSRKQFEEEIMTSLTCDDRFMIGISGMGGLGKTFMANKIRNRALEEHVFDEVVMSVVSQQVDESKIQQQIAEQLGVNLVEQTLMARANRLRERLNDSKRTLLILDDVWESLKLVELGIPCGSEGCRILFTSRNHDALSGMDVGKVFGMEILSEEEAWSLFRGKAGTCVDDMRLNSIAKEVVRECSGLPIALVTVGAAMKDEKDEHIWKDAVKQLRKANPKNIPNFIKEVYNPLKVSYSKLASEEAKSLCLLCCLFPEDDNISVDQLTYFCMGLHILEDVMSLEDARDRMCGLIKMLKSRSLLLDGRYTDCVRMHDVVRDVCTFIAKQEGYIDGNECNWISSFERSELPTGLGFPNLRLLFLTKHRFPKEEEEIKINNINNFFEGIRDLYVLSMEEYPWTSLPPIPTQSLTNLGTLILKSCEKLETISVVGDLVNLEILICFNCSLIKELPVEMGRLNRLKLLDLSGCFNLQSIGRGIISSLVGLEELKMGGSFKKWEAEDIKERKNAGLRELESLTNLTCLEIEIEDAALAAQNMRLSSNLKRFHITVGRERRYTHEGNIMELRWNEGTCLGDWVQMHLLKDTQSLSLSGDGVNNLELEKIPYNIFTNLSVINIVDCPHLHNLGQLSIAGNDCLPHLEFLTIKNCEVMEQVFLLNQEEEEENKNDHITKMFPKLKEVELKSLPNLTTFCQGIEGIEFPLLAKMDIGECPKMTSMISSCCVNRIGSNENNSGGRSNEDQSSHLFCQQEKVSLGGIEFPLLEEMRIGACPKMTSMISSCCVNRIGSNENNSGGKSNEDHSSHLFCQQEKVSFVSLKILGISDVGIENPFYCHKIPMSFFNGLEELTIYLYHGIVSLFTSSIAGSLVSLRELHIWSCTEMEQVIKEEEGEEKTVSGGERRTLVFPNLRWIALWNLPKLVTFFESKCDVEFPSLTSMQVKGCPNMTNFTLGRLIAPNWEAWDTDLGHRLDVSSWNMKNLTICTLEYPLCHYKISASFFTRLDKLHISFYGASMSLFSSTIAQNLVNVRDLKIAYSHEIIQVIKDNDEDEKVVSGGEKTPLFPKLERLELNYLSKLVTFCEWNCDIELPSLKKVVIINCPNMRNVTLGPLTTPILEDIIIDREDVGATKDLNGLLQQRFGRAKEAKEEVEQENENEEEKPSNFINIKEIKSEQEEEEENENEKDQEEKQSNVINNNEIRSEQEEKDMKGEIEEEQK